MFAAAVMGIQTGTPKQSPYVQNMPLAGATLASSLKPISVFASVTPVFQPTTLTQPSVDRLFDRKPMLSGDLAIGNPSGERPLNLSYSDPAILPSVLPAIEPLSEFQFDTAHIFQTILTLASIRPTIESLGVQTKGNSPIKVVDTKPKVTATSNIEDKIVTVVASGASLATVVDMLCEQSKANIVLVSPSESKITVRLVQVRLSDALNHLCAVTGLTNIKSKSTYVIGDEAKLKQAYPVEWAKLNPPTVEANTEPVKVEPKEPMAIETFFSNNVDVESLSATLKAVFEKDGLVITPGPSTRSPILSNVDTSSSTGVSAGSMESNDRKLGRMLIFRGPESAVTAARKLATELDVERKQVSIGVTIHDVTDDALKQLGLDYNIGGTTVTETDPKGINFGSFTRSPFGFGVAIQALETQDKAKLLARPNISVMDMERAYVLIGNKINLPRIERYDNNGVPVFTAVEYRVGIYLQVAPQISEDGTITLSLYPQVSTIAGFNEVNGAKYPNIATREAQTTLRLKSGETLVIAGLMRNEELTAFSKVPIVGDIPIIGELFKRRRTTKAASQVIISLTPTLVQPQK